MSFSVRVLRRVRQLKESAQLAEVVVRVVRHSKPKFGPLTALYPGQMVIELGQVLLVCGKSHPAGASSSGVGGSVRQ